jgi:uncharacterized protein
MSEMPNYDVERLLSDLTQRGFATMPLLQPTACAEIADLYDDPSRFRKRIVMEDRGYGRGEYQYFQYPLPPVILRLRQALYRPLAAVANKWTNTAAHPVYYPEILEDYLASCHAAGQTKATPLLLRYEAGGFNCLHQDLYGEKVFPLQITVLLSKPERDFTGGEFLLVEQLPDAQARGVVVPLQQGDAVIFATRERPSLQRGTMTAMHHGVSEVRSGRRQTLGLIFHDAA